MIPNQPCTSKNIFLADDDNDDCILFEEALREVCLETQLKMANDGQQLMEMLDESVPPPPDVIFLDLNMPRKNGFECLDEIKQTVRYQGIPIVILSTSSNQANINKVYEQGADFYICKPRTFPLLKKAIHKIMTINWNEHVSQPARDKFFLSFQ